MNQSDRSDPAGQSADLRTRIAAVLNANLPVMEYLRPGDTERAADAVIRELRLHVVTVGDFQTVIKGSYPKPLEESDV